MRRLWPSLLLIILALAACTGAQLRPTQDPSDITCEVYYAAAQMQSGPALKSVAHTLSPSLDLAVEELMDLLLTQPSTPGLTCVFPREVTLLSWTLEADILHLNLSEAYGGLSGIDLTLADYCIALTFCQLEQVQLVMISVEGVLTPYRDHQMLRGSDVLLPSSLGDLTYQAVTLYFPLVEERALGTEYIDVILTDGQQLYTTVARALLNGPADQTLTSPFPKGTQLLSVSLEENICIVDFSAPFGLALLGDSKDRDLTLYAIVNTLCALEQVDQVQIMVEGAPPLLQDRLLGPLEPALNLVKIQD